MTKLTKEICKDLEKNILYTEDQIQTEKTKIIDAQIQLHHIKKHLTFLINEKKKNCIKNIRK